MHREYDVILINPGNPSAAYQHLSVEFSALEPPTFTALVARHLQLRELRVALIDIPSESDSIEEIAQRVADFNPYLVGVFVYGYQPSASTQNMPAAQSIIDALRNIDPSIKIMLSGTHPASLPERTLEETGVDYVCDREGFATTRELVECLKVSGNLKKVPDLWIIEDGKPSFTHRGASLPKNGLEYIVDRPAWDLLNMGKYRSHNWHSLSDLSKRQPYASIYTSLDCPFSCFFCCIAAPFGKAGYWTWDSMTVVDQIEILVRKYGVYNIKIVDEMFLMNEAHVLGISNEIIKRGLGDLINIWFYGRVDVTGKLDVRNPALLETMQKAGFRWIALGIESASEFVRDGQDKKYSNSDIINVVRTIQNSGMHVIGNFIFGLPDDTLETMQSTLDMALELKTEWVNMYCGMAYPGSQLHRQYTGSGLLPEENGTGWIGYSQHTYETFPLPTATLSNAEVLKFRDEAFLKYFTDDAYVASIQKKFGDDAVSHIKKMANLPHLRRKLLESA